MLWEQINRSELLAWHEYKHLFIADLQLLAASQTWNSTAVPSFQQNSRQSALNNPWSGIFLLSWKSLKTGIYWSKPQTETCQPTEKDILLKCGPNGIRHWGPISLCFSLQGSLPDPHNRSWTNTSAAARDRRNLSGEMQNDIEFTFDTFLAFFDIVLPKLRQESYAIMCIIPVLYLKAKNITFRYLWLIFFCVHWTDHNCIIRRTREHSI